MKLVCVYNMDIYRRYYLYISEINFYELCNNVNVLITKNKHPLLPLMVNTICEMYMDSVRTNDDILCYEYRNIIMSMLDVLGEIYVLTTIIRFTNNFSQQSSFTAGFFRYNNKSHSDFVRLVLQTESFKNHKTIELNYAEYLLFNISQSCSIFGSTDDQINYLIFTSEYVILHCNVSTSQYLLNKYYKYIILHISTPDILNKIIDQLTNNHVKYIPLIHYYYRLYGNFDLVKSADISAQCNAFLNCKEIVNITPDPPYHCTVLSVLIRVLHSVINHRGEN